MYEMDCCKSFNRILLKYLSVRILFQRTLVDFKQLCNEHLTGIILSKITRKLQSMEEIIGYQIGTRRTRIRNYPVMKQVLTLN